MQQNFVLKFHPTLSAHYPSPFPSCHLITFPPLQLCHLPILPPFPPFHLTALTYLYHIANPLNSHTFPTFPAHYSPTFATCSVLASFFIAMIRNSFENFKLIHFLLWTKGSHQSPNFDTFKCSGESLPNCTFHIPNHRIAFLEISHHFSVSGTITPVYFFSSNNVYFAPMERH